MSKFFLLSTCFCVLISGCATKQHELYRRINVAYDFEVTHCDSFALVTGVSRHENQLDEAKESATAQGEELGGTHIVWLQVDMGDPTKVVAIIYKCLI
ncbi:hypothetical protein L5M43_03350 [Shewanella sp. SW36]|uniref:hypothetical protein n=1 Tax=Shewanella TaxID=22 RepID=UPI000DEB2095|nr:MULTISPECIES: hypothetical protein [unclassified Shewanella]MBW3529389.1 hypothetical protein [Shewanella sp. NKUCC06_TVS]MCU7963095.1 hypothetical protein [Shewanella sp. SW32]MCU7970991.1 hypothetical protein [Shewanella sp. SW29]MCU7974310.1 hypothetical protein [Shewanella sp. SW36]MCU7989162.1 hypothetical protein [Shewanella sp. SW1]